MSHQSRKLPEFVVGDLVYYVGNIYGHVLGAPLRAAHSTKRVGIVVTVNTTGYHTYGVYWLSDELASNHVANHLELVYNV